MANSANALNIKSAGIPVFDGTATFTESTTTQYNVLVGGTSNAIGNVSPSATSGVPLVSGGAAANPSFGTAVVAGGGTGQTTLLIHGVLVGNTTSGITSLAVGTTGQVLQGNTGADPSWGSPAASSITITGDSGGGLTGASFTFTGGTTGLTFAGAGSTETLGGTLAVKNGGTGAATLTGVLTGNGTSAVTANAITQYGTVVAGASNAVASVAPSATSGVPYISQGNAANPTFGTAVVAGGGTGQVTLTNHGVLVGAGTSGITQLAVGTTGQVLQGNTGADPSWGSPAASSITITGNSGGGLTGTSFTFTGGTTGLTFAGAGSTETLGGTLVVANGGTGQTTLTAHGVLLGNGTTAITQLAAAATGSTLMGSTGADPAFTGSPSFSGSVTAGTTLTATLGAITATSGNVVITSGNLTLPLTTSAVGQIVQNGNRILHTYNGPTSQIFVGYQAGNFTLSQFFNTGIGAGSLAALTSGSNNTGIGYFSGNVITSGTNNFFGGMQTGVSLLTGSYNIGLGYQAASGYGGSESNNICLNAFGTGSESNTLRIGIGTGTGTQQLNKAIVCGIQGITVTGTAVLVSSSDQLGIAVSSRKYKENIEDMADESDRLYKLRPVTFTLKEYQDKSKQFGLIAEEVYDIMPELVVLDKEGQPQSVQYHNLPALLLNELQKLRKEVDALRTYCSTHHN